MTGTVAEYDHKLDPEDRKKYEKEVERWKRDYCKYACIKIAFV